MKKCNNLSCKNNKKGLCNKENSPEINSTYDTLLQSQWLIIRKHMEKRRKEGLEPFKACNNTHCINNISGGCFLPSEMEVLSIIL